MYSDETKQYYGLQYVYVRMQCYYLQYLERLLGVWNRYRVGLQGITTDERQGNNKTNSFQSHYKTTMRTIPPPLSRGHESENRQYSQIFPSRAASKPEYMLTRLI